MGFKLRTGKVGRRNFTSSILCWLFLVAFESVVVSDGSGRCLEARRGSGKRLLAVPGPDRVALEAAGSFHPLMQDSFEAFLQRGSISTRVAPLAMREWWVTIEGYLVARGGERGYGVCTNLCRS